MKSLRSNDTKKKQVERWELGGSEDKWIYVISFHVGESFWKGGRQTLPSRERERRHLRNVFVVIMSTKQIFKIDLIYSFYQCSRKHSLTCQVNAQNVLSVLQTA